MRELNKKEFEVMNTSLEGNNKLLTTSFETINKTLETRLNKMTETQDRNFNLLREENNKQIDKIRETVSEKLDKTLNEQFDKSFKGVLTQMTELQKTMGELKGISSQVGSLEKTLNGIKTRGISGEVQLKQIIADVLPPQHYDVEVATKPGSGDHVEIAIKLPDREGKSFYYLPIDSKCHLDRYEALLNAYDGGDTNLIRKAKKEFADAIRSDAKDIAEKYISVPNTTPYAILFVPFEGMYSEIVNLDLLDDLNPLHITVAGPYTLMAILSTITNYFQALAIEKKSHEIEVTLGKVKKEFKNYEDMLAKVQKNLETASDNLEKLQTTRTNAINKALKGITEMDEGLLPDGTDEEESEE
jgi:DNA recombination protein RmuC